MNFARNAILTAIIFQMVHSTFPVSYGQAYASEPKATDEQQTIQSINTFVDSTRDQYSQLIKLGCINEFGETTDKYATDATEVEKVDGKGINCKQAAKNYDDARKEALDLAKDEEKKLNENCATCGGPLDPLNKVTNGWQDDIESKLHEGKNCSEADKKKFAAEKCDWTCGTKNSLAELANGGIPGMLGSIIGTKFKKYDGPHCPQVNMEGGQCLADIVKTLVLSMGDLLLGTWNTITGALSSAGKWAEGLFSAHKEPIKLVTKKMLPITNMTDKEFKEAKEDHGAGFINRALGVLGTIADFFTNYKELGTEFQCYSCRDKAKPLCKVIGLVGRDLIIMWLSGKAFKAMGAITKRLANKTAFTRTLYRGTVRAVGRLSKKTLAGLSDLRVKTVKFAKFVDKKVNALPSKITLKPMNIFRKAEQKAMQNDANIIAGLGKSAEKSATQGIEQGTKSVEELVVGVKAKGETEAVADAISDIRKLPNAKNKKIGLIDGIESAEPVSVNEVERTATTVGKEITTSVKNLKRVKKLEPVTSSEGRFAEVIDKEGVPRRFPIQTDKKIVSAQLFENSRGETNAILSHTDGSYKIYTQEGATGGRTLPRVSGAPEPIVYDAKGSINVPVEKAALIDEATGKTIKGRPAGEVRADAIEQNLKDNNINHVRKGEVIEYDEPAGCGGGKGSINCATGAIQKAL